MHNEEGSIGITVVSLAVIGLLLSIFFINFQTSNEVVSGIAYNTSNDNFISGNTTFSVRASESTYVSEENKSSYCLPPNSQYKQLVNRAAQDKRVKVSVTAKKYFAVQMPWTCYPSVTVEEVK